MPRKNLGRMIDEFRVPEVEDDPVRDALRRAGVKFGDEFDVGADFGSPDGDKSETSTFIKKGDGFVVTGTKTGRMKSGGIPPGVMMPGAPTPLADVKPQIKRHYSLYWEDKIDNCGTFEAHWFKNTERLIVSFTPINEVGYNAECSLPKGISADRYEDELQQLKGFVLNTLLEDLAYPDKIHWSGRDANTWATVAQDIYKFVDSFIEDIQTIIVWPK